MSFTDGNHQFAARLELRQQGLRDVVRCGSDHDAVKGGDDLFKPNEGPDVLDLLLAHELVVERQLVAGGGIDRLGDADATGLGQPLEARGDIDPVTVDVISFDDAEELIN